MLIQGVRDLGVTSGQVLVVHTAFSQLRPAVQRPEEVIDGLLEVLGSTGTLVMPSMADDDDEPFDPSRTSCLGMGVVADTFWRRPDVLRSNSPHAFAAIGPAALEILAPHPVEVPHGPESPVGRARAAGAQILLLGVGHEANTTIHLAEDLYGVRYRVPRKAMIRDPEGRRRIVEYPEIDHCCERFERLDDALGPHQRRGWIGAGRVRLVHAQAVVEAACRLLDADETAFLHPRGACVDCDVAWESLD